MNLNISEIHNNSMQNLHKITQILAETEDIGSKTLEQLSIDKEKLLNINKNVDQVNEKVSISRRILRKMNWADDKKKLAVGGGSALVAAGAITTAVLIKK